MMSRPTLQAVFLATLLAAAQPAGAGKKEPEPPPDLSTELHHSSGRFTVKAPAGWTLKPVPGNSEAVETGDGTIAVRFVFWSQENGYDSLHSSCMLERLADAMETSPEVHYEYDFVGGAVSNRRVLDSAFSVKYDKAVRGSREWRQRNVTIVGEGQSLCIVTYAPLAQWKKSAPTRGLLDGMIASLTFH